MEHWSNMYRGRPQDGTQEMERNYATAKMLPGPAVPGCCLVSFHFLWDILWPHSVLNITYNDITQLCPLGKNVLN